MISITKDSYLQILFITPPDLIKMGVKEFIPHAFSGPVKDIAIGKETTSLLSVSCGERGREGVGALGFATCMPDYENGLFCFDFY